MYLQDGAPYTYADLDLPDVIAIGWLDCAHPFTRGRAPAGLVAMLLTIAERGSVHQMRGYHYCDFCYAEPGYPGRDGRMHPLGSSEIWVRDAVGRIYAAPNLVVHYILRHRYGPPATFVEAVRHTHAHPWDADAHLWAAHEAQVERRRRTDVARGDS